MPDDARMQGELFEARSFVIEPFADSPTTDEGAARAWLSAGEGWIETHRELMPWRSGDPLPEGRVLIAELRLDEATSLEVRWDGRHWIGARIREQDGAGSVLEVEHLSTVPGRRMVYRTWWGLVDRDGVRVLEACASRFAGWRDDPQGGL